jgi:hypothetical protein
LLCECQGELSGFGNDPREIFFGKVMDGGCGITGSSEKRDYATKHGKPLLEIECDELFRNLFIGTCVFR